jgi:hypothetical protein
MGLKYTKAIDMNFGGFNPLNPMASTGTILWVRILQNSFGNPINRTDT